MNDQMPSTDLSPAARVPSAIEIGAAIAGLVPFVIQSATVSSETVNGQTVSWVYRDWIAIACGGIAALGALIGLLQLRRTDPAKRALRIAIVLGLLALGALQVLRGIGRIGANRPEVVSRDRVATVPVSEAPKQPAIPAVDVDGATRRLFEAWRDGKTAEIREAAHPDLKSAATQEQFDELFHKPDARYGKLQKLDEKLTNRYEDETFFVDGTATYEKGKLDVRVAYQLVDGKPLLVSLNFDIPDDVTPDPAEAQQIAKRVLDGLLAGEVRDEHFHAKLKKNLPDDMKQQLDSVRADIGKVKSIGAPVPRECTDRVSKYCILQDVVGSKRRATYAAEFASSFEGPILTAFDLRLVDE